MAAERYVLLGLARPRAAWFSAVARWATSAAIPAEFVKCVSPAELRSRLASGRAFSAVLLDAGLPAVDRDLLAAARDAACPAIVVDDGAGDVDWRALGAAGLLPAELRREELLDVLAHHARQVRAVEAPGAAAPAARAGEAGRVVAVCGPGGTGASTAAMALAQGFGAAADVGSVVLADLRLRAEQAMLHDARDVFPGVQELVEAHRSRRPSSVEIREATFWAAERGYHLLLGLRRPTYWPAIRPRAFTELFASLRATFDGVVCDVDADFEGEEETGSVDVEERHVMTRTALAEADVVVVVGAPGMKGVHALTQHVSRLTDFGVETARVLPVVNRVARSPRVRAQLASAVGTLLADVGGGAPLASPVFLPERKVEQALRDAAPLPAPLPETLVGAVRAVATRAGSPHRSQPGPAETPTEVPA